LEEEGLASRFVRAPAEAWAFAIAALGRTAWRQGSRPRSPPLADEVGAGEAGAFRLSRLTSSVKERGSGSPELPDGLADRSFTAIDRSFAAMDCSFTAMDRSFAAVERSAVAAERSFATIDLSFTTKERSVASAEHSFATDERSAAAMER
jgi:hypothetical protein